MNGRLRAVTFPGPAGLLEGLWKKAMGPRRGSAVLAHPHPLHGGTMHSKVVYRAAQAFTGAGYATLRFHFRGVGRSAGHYDEGRGEVGDFRAALDEAAQQEGLPILAGGFSFGAAAALRAIEGDPRVDAYVGIGLPVATESAVEVPRPRIPALFVVGDRDSLGPPDQLRRFVGDSGRVVEIASADHFFEGRLAALERVVADFLAERPIGVLALP